MSHVQPAAAVDGRKPDDDAPHILVIDDDRRIRGLLSRFLSEHGFRVSVLSLIHI